MNFINKAAKAVVAAAGAVVTLGGVIIAATADGNIDGSELSSIITAAVAGIVTVIGVYAKGNAK